ncbi:MAG: sulfurtransferase-like selenium metabolism protein YedF [Chloroflexota bacterium]
MVEIIDARGLACPQPVIMTKKAMAHASAVTVIVNGPTAEANVSRMARKEGWQVTVEARDGGAHLVLSRADAAATETLPVGRVESVPAEGPLVIYISADCMGRGEDELGGVLIRAFLHTLNKVAPLPDTLIFVNTGVRLVVAGSPVLEDLEALSQQGVEILACGTCLNYLELMDQVAIGTVSNMYTIAETLLSAGKVVSP